MAPGRTEQGQDAFWEHAGRIGYSEALFRSRRVARHVLEKQWQVALETAAQLGLGGSASVLELGAGDGQFAVEVLAPRYHRIVALEKSRTAVDRAAARPGAGKVEFRVADVTVHEYPPGARWDGAFLMGFLHHVKAHAPAIVGRLSGVVPRVVVLEPNGGQPMRKLLERLPSYRAGGEESFHLRELVEVFARAGFRLRECTAINLFPPFMPDALFPAVRAVERIVEATPFLRGLCSSYVLGFAADS